MNFCRSILVTGAFLIGLNGCAGSTRKSIAPDNGGWFRTQELVQRYGENTSPSVQAFLAEFTLRIMTPLVRHRPTSPPLKIHLIETDEPIAYALGGGQVAVSREMLRRLPTEGEFAFVIAHELAHELLEHTRIYDRFGQADAEMPLPEDEVSADRQALGIIAIAGYDPRIAPYALVHAYGSRSPDEASPRYPSLRERLGAIQEELDNSDWRPPGTTDRRGYQRLRRTALRAR